MSSFIAYRLVCTNGLVAARAFSRVKCRNRGEQEAQISSFIGRCKTNNIQLEKFAGSYRQLATDNTVCPDNRQLFRVWSGIRKILGDPDIADSIIGIEPETRSKLRVSVKAERQYSFGEDDDNSDDFKLIREIPWFSLINQITASANNFTGLSRTRLQELGGKVMFQAMKSISD